MAFRSTVADARMFLRAPTDMIEGFRDRLAIKRHLPASRPGRHKWSWRSLLSGGDARRLEDFRQLAATHHWGNKPVRYLACITQNAERYKPSFGFFQVPALMRSSLLFYVSDTSPAGDRLVLPAELLCMQCLPVFLEEGSRFLRFFGFRHLLDRDADLRHIAGNGMNLSSIGKVVLFCLATCERVCDVPAGA